MAEKNQRSNTKMATTLMAYAQLEIDNSSTCIPRLIKYVLFYLFIYLYLIRLCKFNIVRIVLNRSIDGGDSNAIVVAVKIQVKLRGATGTYIFWDLFFPRNYSFIRDLLTVSRFQRIFTLALVLTFNIV